MIVFYLKKRTILITMLILICFSFVYFFYTKTDETFNTGVYYKGTIDSKMVAFACNVDWGNEYIEPMLKVFENHGIKITFFVTGRWAEKYPDMLRLIYEEGHEIGNHGYNHVDYDKLSYQQNLEEIYKAHKAIKNALNIDTSLFAPPSGAYSDNTIEAAQELNYNIIMWSVDTIDWREDSHKKVIKKRVLDKIHNSAIVLMHPTEETLKALPEIILELEKQGYSIGTVSNIIE